MDEQILNRRLQLRESLRLADRLEKSPNITECHPLSPCLQIHHAPRDIPVLPSIKESLHTAYDLVKTWFEYPEDLAVTLWMAPEAQDLQYMVCMPCSDTCFFAPGERDGRNIVVFVSPQSCPINKNALRMTALLAHEITHHIIVHLAHASRDATKRKQNLDVPMWLEEGLCQLMECASHPSIRQSFAERVAKIPHWYDPEDLWDALCSCPDTDRAYLQAYETTRRLVEKRGKAEVLRLLAQHRERKTDWRVLTKNSRQSFRSQTGT